MHVLQTTISGNPNVGLYLYANDHYCIAGHEVPENVCKKIEQVLNVPVHQMNICGTSLVGVFLAGNNNCLLVPHIAFESEIKNLKKLNIPFKVIEADLTALGNNILCNDTGALVNPDFSASQKKEIRQALGTNLKPGTLAELQTVGSLGVLSDKGGVIHSDASDEETRIISDLLNLECEPGTTNLGSPFVRSGVCANKNGFIVSEICGGPEITWIDEVLGFLE